MTDQLTGVENAEPGKWRTNYQGVENDAYFSQLDSDLHKIWGGDRLIIVVAPKEPLDLRYVASFRN